MRLQSPQVQLGVLFAYGLLVVAVVEFLTPCVMTLLDERKTHVYVDTWREQVVICVAGVLGILATNLLGPRILLLLGTTTGTLLSAAMAAAAHGVRGGHAVFLAAKVADDVGHTMTRVCLVTMALTYPCERKKARVLALFQFVLDMFVTLGEVLRQNHGAGHSGRTQALSAVWARLAFTGVSAVCALWVTPLGAVVRDSGVFVIAREAKSVRREVGKTWKLFGNKYMLLLMPYLFSFPFALGIMGMSFPDRQSVLLYNAGALLALVLAFVLDAGSEWRRRRGQLGFALVTFVTAVCLSAMTVLNTRPVDERALPALAGHPGSPVNAYRLLAYAPLFYATVFFNGMSISCVFLFSGWVIGSLTNDAEYTARFSGALLSVPALGTLAAYLSLGTDDWRPHVPANSPLFVGIALLAFSSLAMYYVVHSISDTNNWSLMRMKNAPRSAPCSEANAGRSCVVRFADDSSVESSSIAKHPMR
ncbi:hypothetical protein LPJ63_004216 [Coemansia sp. RSA 2711]|nr:hypothetical protein LPJ63_004216 [Coemansia sp. RSA 2711]